MKEGRGATCPLREVGGAWVGAKRQTGKPESQGSGWVPEGRAPSSSEPLTQKILGGILQRGGLPPGGPIARHVEETNLPLG